jgi:hypothetical protein
MKRLLAILALLSITLMLFGCGGGGGDNTTNNTPTDSTAPVVTAFALQAPATGMTATVTTFTATDSTGVTGYQITATSTAPSASASGWTATAPTTFTFTATGSQTAYAWAKDAAGNVSASKSATVTITGALALPVTGAVINPVTGLAVSGATVSAFVQLNNLTAKAVAAPVATFTTDINGNYNVTGLFGGVTYYFEISITGFATFNVYNITPSLTNGITMERVHVLPSSIASLTATASGKVLNASTNTGLPNMTVKIRPGINAKYGTVSFTATTDTAGAYSFANLAAGTYTAEITGNIGTTAIITSYFTLVSIPSTNLNTNQNFPVTTALSTTGTGQYKIVLNWGNDPSDLDSHLTGPTVATGANATAGTRFHTYYSGSNKSYPLGSTITDDLGNRIAGPTTEAFLDVDNTYHGTDNGPETTTIVVPHTGTYKFYVHHYNGSSTISASGAQVKVYKGNSLLATFNPPYSALGDEAVWSVFSMDVTSGGETITTVNTIDMISTGSLPKIAGGGFEDYFLFSNMPRK